MPTIPPHEVMTARREHTRAWNLLSTLIEASDWKHMRSMLVHERNSRMKAACSSF